MVFSKENSHSDLDRQSSLDSHPNLDTSSLSAPLEIVLTYLSYLHLADYEHEQFLDSTHLIVITTISINTSDTLTLFHDLNIPHYLLVLIVWM